MEWSDKQKGREWDYDDREARGMKMVIKRRDRKIYPNAIGDAGRQVGTGMHRE